MSTSRKTGAGRANVQAAAPRGESPDYAIGRGKPPRHKRFKPGQSGNPGGRPKGSRNFKTILQEILEAGIELTENGRKRKVTLVAALIKRQAQEGLRGNMRAIENLLDRYERHAPPEPLAEDDEFPERDADILRRALAVRDLAFRGSPSARARESDDEAMAERDVGLEDLPEDLLEDMPGVPREDDLRADEDDGDG